MFSIGGQLSEGQTSMTTDDDVANIIKEHLNPSKRVGSKQVTKNIGTEKKTSEEPKMNAKGGLIYGLNN